MTNEERKVIELALEALETDWGTVKAITAIKEVLAQPEQEPVAYVKTVIEALYENSDPVSVEAAELLERITTPPQQELVCVCGAVWEGQELIYTTPQRKPLTEQEIGAILEDTNAFGTRLYTFARAIEAARGIKE